MAAKEVAILNTGVANIASVKAGLERGGATTRFVDQAANVEGAEFLIFPGVGAFGAGMKGLREKGVVEALRGRFEKDLPTMAICLGLQLLFEESEESPGVEGLGVVSGKVERFPRTLRVPQFGWNKVRAAEGSAYLSDGYAYFANSFAVREVPQGWLGSLSDYGGSFVAAMERGRCLAAQFHPEISGPWGQEVLNRWLNQG